MATNLLSDRKNSRITKHIAGKNKRDSAAYNYPYSHQYWLCVNHRFCSQYLVSFEINPSVWASEGQTSNITAHILNKIYTIKYVS